VGLSSSSALEEDAFVDIISGSGPGRNADEPLVLFVKEKVETLRKEKRVRVKENLAVSYPPDQPEPRTFTLSGILFFRYSPGDIFYTFFDKSKDGYWEARNSKNEFGVIIPAHFDVLPD